MSTQNYQEYKKAGSTVALCKCFCKHFCSKYASMQVCKTDLPWNLPGGFAVTEGSFVGVLSRPPSRGLVHGSIYQEGARERECVCVLSPALPYYRLQTCVRNLTIAKRTVYQCFINYAKYNVLLRQGYACACV